MDISNVGKIALLASTKIGTEVATISVLNAASGIILSKVNITAWDKTWTKKEKLSHVGKVALVVAVPIAIMVTGMVVSGIVTTQVSNALFPNHDEPNLDLI